MASVFARPGTPSSKMCPLPRSPIISLSIIFFCPMIFLFISSERRSTKALSCFISSSFLLKSMFVLLSLIIAQFIYSNFKIY